MGELMDERSFHLERISFRDSDRVPLSDLRSDASRRTACLLCTLGRLSCCSIAAGGVHLAVAIAKVLATALPLLYFLKDIVPTLIQKCLFEPAYGS